MRKDDINKVFVPPLKIQGIKTKLVPLIKETSSVDNDTTWVEPFMGSGVVGFNVAKKSAIFADTNPHIINFYLAIQNGMITPEIVRDFLTEQGQRLSEKDDKYYYEVRSRFNEKHEPLDFLFLNRACFNGMMRFNKNNDFNVPYGHKPNRFTKAYVTKITNQVKKVEQLLRDNNWVFVCQSFEKTITECPKSSFIYCDPPYIGRHVDYFDSWDENLEKQLHDLLASSNRKFMLSTWDHNAYRKNEYVSTLWKDNYKTTKKHFYHVGAKKTNRNVVTEALLTNYAFNTRKMSL